MCAMHGARVGERVVAVRGERKRWSMLFNSAGGRDRRVGCSRRHLGRCKQRKLRALKLGSFPSATLDNVVNADIGGAKKFLGSARSGARGVFAAAVAILVIAIRVGLAECSTVLG